MNFIANRTEGDPARFREDQIAPKFCRGPLTEASICGPDQRIKVTDTSSLPFKAICKLFMRAPNGRPLVGTGWLTHSNKLLTAGHCVFDVEEGGWMDSITVVPGMSGHAMPFGRFTHGTSSHVALGSITGQDDLMWERSSLRVALHTTSF